MITRQMVLDATARLEYHRFQGTNSVVCALVMTNGHVVVGEAHCAPGTKFDGALGMESSREDAERKVGQLLAYEQRAGQQRPFNG